MTIHDKINRNVFIRQQKIDEYIEFEKMVMSGQPWGFFTGKDPRTSIGETKFREYADKQLSRYGDIHLQ